MIALIYLTDNFFNDCYNSDKMGGGGGQLYAIKKKFSVRVRALNATAASYFII